MGSVLRLLRKLTTINKPTPVHIPLRTPETKTQYQVSTPPKGVVQVAVAKISEHSRDPEYSTRAIMQGETPLIKLMALNIQVRAATKCLSNNNIIVDYFLIGTNE